MIPGPAGGMGTTILMRTTFSTAFLLASALAFASACTATTTEPTTTEKPAEQPGAGTPAPGGEATNPPPPAETPSACADAPAGTVADVTVSALKSLIDSGAKLAVVDVREPDETAEGTIKGALLFPWTGKVLQARHSELPTDRPIYVICRSGSRSSAASDFLAKNGHSCIHDVQGGMNAWTSKSFPTEK